ncbi:MAG: GumC family protein [Elainellaceae cyanobacterium]
MVGSTMNATDFSKTLLSAVRRHCWLAIGAFSSTLGAAFFYLLTSPPLYESSVRVMVEDQQTSVSALGQALSDLTNSAATGVNPLATQVELITSPQVLRDALDQAAAVQTSEAPPLPGIGEVKDGLSITIIPATNLLDLSYTSPSPELAAQLLNAIASSAAQANAAAIRREASSVRQFLETEVPQQKALLSQAEAEEQSFRQANGIVSIEAQSAGLVSSIAELDREARVLKSQIQETAERQQVLDDITGVNTLSDAYRAVQLGQDEEVIELKNRLTGVEAQIAEARSRLGDQHPELLALLDERDQLRELYAEALGSPQGFGGVSGTAASSEISQNLLEEYILGEIEQQALRERFSSVEQQRTNLSNLAAELPGQQQALVSLIRRREEAEQALRLLQNKLEEARIAEAQIVSNIRILGQAEVPGEASAPNAPLILVLGGVTGLLLAGSLIVVMEALDDAIHSAKEIETLLQLPVLGSLPPLPPRIGGVHQLDEFLNQDSLVEPYRRLLKVLKHRCQEQVAALAGQERGHAIVLSGITPEDGQAAVSIYLSAVSAMLTQRTLLIEADPRERSQSRFFRLKSEQGLVDVVTQQQDAAALVKPLNLKNLFLLPYGRMPERPAVISETATMADFLQQLPHDYDLTLVDAAAAAVSVDAATLSQRTDGLVLVVQPHTTQRSQLIQVAEELRRSGTPIIGVVFNEAQVAEAEPEPGHGALNLLSRPLGMLVNQTRHDANVNATMK